MRLKKKETGSKFYETIKLIPLDKIQLEIFKKLSKSME